jgi:hypothetical protein
MGCDDTMKPWPLLIGIIVILAFMSSPALAISKSDLISFYKGQSVPTTPTPTPRIPSWHVIPTTPPAHDVIEPPPDWVGSISVVSDPAGAEVYLDGTYQGTTPIIISGVAASYYPCDGCIGYPATHTIKLTKTGYKDHITDGSVTKGETMSISATLTPISQTLPSWIIPPERPLPTIIPTTIPTRAPAGTESLMVLSDPAGAKVYLDGQFKGISPLALMGLSAGSHQLKLTKFGYADFTYDMTVVAGKSNRIRLVGRDGCFTIGPGSSFMPR